MFDFFKKKKTKEQILGAPVAGVAVPLEEVSDPTFGEGILGLGVAIRPTEGKIYAPADGEIGMLFDTLHAVTMTTEAGAEVLVHVGLDTVRMSGEGFVGHVKAGDKVKKGDLLIEVDLEKVKAAGYDTITPVIICNTADYESVAGLSGKDVKPGDDVVVITEK